MLGIPVSVHRQRGLTLIELVVVLAIFGFALAAAMPSVSQWMRNLSVRNTAESMRAAVERARLEALRRNTSMGFWLVEDSTSKVLTGKCTQSVSGPSWVVSVNSPEGACDVAPSSVNEPKIVDSWSPSNSGGAVTVAGTDADGNAVDNVVFNSLGQAQAGGLATIDISDSTSGSTALRVMIGAGGSIRLCMPSAAVGDARRC
ncbi:GspH/FimT family pseudopilin [Paucibacter sp. APW11]|uniref:Type II secretion system protein H n=1 Tax=Roseateles aquae TaxID=3077235 RepID=A0ABU3PHU1_9BURK|nr:GspH/FimT family pseudopilin [Paucibacter sp. APW11]MDT9002139.1 GspH/FimT family pseudopilin [Paucibacter sp. APW11]